MGFVVADTMVRPMATERHQRNKELERRFIEEAFNEGALAVVDEVCAADYVGHTSTRAEPLDGPAEIKEYIELTRTAFPDIELDLEHVIADGDRVASHWVATGTHQGELMGIEPTGRTYRARGMEITRVDNGKIAEQWHVGDQMGMLQQLGIIDPPEP